MASPLSKGCREDLLALFEGYFAGKYMVANPRGQVPVEQVRRDSAEVVGLIEGSGAVLRRQLASALSGQGDSTR